MDRIRRLLVRLGWKRRPAPHRAAVLPAVPALPLVARWSDSDRDQLAAFLGSDTGIKLQARLQALTYRRALDNASEDIENHAHAAGVSVGYDECRKHILRLGKLSEAEPQKPAEVADTELEELLRRYSA